LNGEGFKQDFQKAMSTYQDGTKVGNDLCWTGLAEIYFQEGHEDNWNKCWRRYFESKFFIEQKRYLEFISLEEIMSNRAYQMHNYGQQAKLRKWKVAEGQLLKDKTGEIKEFYELHKNHVTKLVSHLAGYIPKPPGTKVIEKRILRILMK
jgi:hypothetical protein